MCRLNKSIVLKNSYQTLFYNLAHMILILNIKYFDVIIYINKSLFKIITIFLIFFVIQFFFNTIEKYELFRYCS